MADDGNEINATSAGADAEVRDALAAAVRSQFKLVIGFAKRLCRSLVTAQELVSIAFLLILEGRRIWDRRVKMTTLICNTVSTLWIDKCRLVFPRRYTGGGSDAVEDAPASALRPDKLVAREAAAAQYENFLEEVRALLTGDELSRA